MKKVLPLLAIAMLLSTMAWGQCEKYARKCSKKLDSYTSDGQYHRALLRAGETAEFTVTFYKGNTYRILGCTGPDSDVLIFKVLDSNYEEIFSNETVNFAQYWNFSFNATDIYYIQATLMPGVESGCAVIMIGFD